MEWLILIFGMLAGFFLIERWKPEWIEKAKSKVKSILPKK